MPCIKLIKQDGSEEIIQPNEPFKKGLGDRVVVDNTCGDVSKTPLILRMTNNSNNIATLDKEIGPGLGDWVKVLASPVARLLGKSNCASCEATRISLNAFNKLKGKYGKVEALKLMAELVVKTKSGEVDSAVRKLQEYLH